MPIDLDLTLFLKETQLQHGLRAEDHARYHRYTSNRLATLRQQLNLSNDKKKFLNKDITVNSANDARHLMILALYSERCWAAAEVQQEVREATAKFGNNGNKPKGGVPPSDQYRKRLNKALKWAEKLHTIASAVGTPRVKEECEAYKAETAGRAAAAHGDYATAKSSFMAARSAYFSLRECSDETQWAVVLGKVAELDDRVVYCMQQLGEEASMYKPETVNRKGQAATGGGAGDGTQGDIGMTTLEWNGNMLPVTSIKVKDALREARAVPVEAAVAKVLEMPSPVSVGHSNKVLDMMDRRINSYNDALSHARQELRAAPEGKRRVTQQLLVHYFLFYGTLETLRRTLFLAEVYSRRFHSTEKALRSSSSTGRNKKTELSTAQYASPLEVVRLYEAAAEAVGEVELLPGVSGREDVAALAAVSLAGRLLYTGESWRVCGGPGAAASSSSSMMASAAECYRAAISALKGVEGLQAEELRQKAERAAVRMSAETALSSSSSAAPQVVEEQVRFLTEAPKGAAAVAQNVTQFPSSYQAVACKPVFVDVASVYVDFPRDGDTEGSAAVATSVGARERTEVPLRGGGSGGHRDKMEEEGRGKKWGWKWGWGSKASS